MPDIIRHHGISYRKLKGGKYKYKLTEDYRHVTAFRDSEGGNPYVELAVNGELTIHARYAWDGPSGPTIDTKSFMRGSLVHDALYQLMRERVLDRERDRKDADRLLRRLCVEDGMWRFRARYVYWFVRMFGGGAAKPRA